MVARRLIPAWTVLVVAVAFGSLPARAGQTSRPRRPTRDTPGQQRQAVSAPATGRISGRVVAADTGRPITRARVALSAAEVPGGRGLLTDHDGMFEFTELPQGRYILTASKNGFVALAYGQRRPLQAGTPLQLASGGELGGIELRLPRGSVISGHVFDETGEPSPGILVRILRYRYVQGVRQLLPAGTAQADDRGEYRVWGLNPGDYYVAAVAREIGGGGRFGRGGRGDGRNAPDAASVDASDARGDDSGYAPTYYPGTDSVETARPVTVGLSVEAVGIDFNLLLVRTSRVSGRVTSVEGAPVTSGNVVLSPEGLGGRIGQGLSFGARVAADGVFTIANVPPGRYVLRARANDWDVPRFASVPVTVSGGDMSGLSLTVAPGATVTGWARFRRSQLSSVAPSQFRIGAPTVDGANLGPVPMAPVGTNGAFRLEGVAVGEHFIRAQVPRGWVLQSVTVDGRDVTDTPLDLKAGQRVSDVLVTFTDKPSEIAGIVSDDRGTPLHEYTVLAFPTDRSLWRPQARHIVTARPDQRGAFRLVGLPPGEYLVALIDPAEQGEWFEPSFLETQAPTAATVLLGEGEVKTHNLTLTSR